MTVHMQTPTESFLSLYKEPEAFRDQQLKVFWTADEIKVEKDIHDILTNFSDSERHGVFTTLKLFTHYEAKAGEDYWTGRYMRMFPRHEFTSMASVFGMFELAVHAPFYNKINTLLNAHDDGFYTDYVKTPVLKARMEFIDSIVNHDDDLVSLAGFSMVEGVILYSSFAFLKHFQSLGKNKLLNVVRGINFSARDENLHAMATAWSYNELKRQLPADDNHLRFKLVEHKTHVLAKTLYDHECEIINMTFEHGEIEHGDVFSYYQNLFTFAEHGEFEHGELEHGGWAYNNLVANYIPENRDANFNVGPSHRATFFICGQTFGTFANVPAARKDEFRQLVLKLKEVNTVAYLLITYT